MPETKDPTRAQLLEECKAAGLKATGWRKERMLEELARTASPEPAEDGAQAPAEDAGGQPEAEDRPEGEAALQPPSSGRAKARSGWCQSPMWSEEHGSCPGGGKAGPGGLAWACHCGCHEEGFERPAPPEGAKLNDMPEGETPGLSKVDPHVLHAVMRVVEPGCPGCEPRHDTIDA